MSRDYTEVTDEQLRAINKRAVEQPSYEQLREQNRVLREALEEFCKATEYVASRMAYQCGLGAGEWEAFIDQTNYYKQYKQGKAALTATSQEATS